MGFSRPRHARPPVSSGRAEFRGGRWPSLALLPFLVLTAAAALARGGAQVGSPAAGSLERGERLYRIHCLNCHGESGRGDGPMAAVLKAPIPDLTRLARSHGGTFPRQEVMGSIDGRYRIESHGLREMPVWGLSFEQRGRDGGREHDVQQRLADLAAYLESIQQSGKER